MGSSSSKPVYKQRGNNVVLEGSITYDKKYDLDVSITFKDKKIKEVKNVSLDQAKKDIQESVDFFKDGTLNNEHLSIRFSIEGEINGERFSQGLIGNRTNVQFFEKEKFEKVENNWFKALKEVYIDSLKRDDTYGTWMGDEEDDYLHTGFQTQKIW